jgi:hypothetical protein
MTARFFVGRGCGFSDAAEAELGRRLTFFCGARLMGEMQPSYS